MKLITFILENYIGERLEAVLSPLAEELGVAINLGGCSFRGCNCKYQLEVALFDPNGQAITGEVQAFSSSAHLFGLESSDLGKQFIFEGQPYNICGIKSKNRKYPIIARSSNGRQYKFACRTVLEALGRDVPCWLDSLRLQS